MRRVVYIFTILGALASCVGGAAGGGILENQAGRHASVDHDCPTKQVSVISSKGPIASRVVVLNVCGQRRTYRDVGGTTNILWQEVTASGITPGAKRITAIEAGSVLRAAKTEVIRCVESEETPPSAIKLRAQVNGDGSALYVGAVPAPSADATTCLRELVGALRFRATGAGPIIFNCNYRIPSGRDVPDSPSEQDEGLGD